MYTTLFLDLDDTLLDFSAAESFAIRYVLKKNGYPSDSETVKTYSKINLSFWKRFERGEILKEEIYVNRFVTLLELLGCEGDPEQISKEYGAKLADGFFTVDGAKEILGYLKDKGYMLYATTNGIAATQYRRVEGSGLSPFFEKVFISEDAGCQKPDPEYFNFVLNNIPEKDKSKILIIGDSQSSDILGGINSGIDTCWFNKRGETPKYSSKYEITDLSELKNIL